MPYRKQIEAPKTIRIKKNDMVKVIAGRDKGKTGRVLEVDRSTGRVLVEGVMLVKRHTRPNPARQIKHAYWNEAGGRRTPGPRGAQDRRGAEVDGQSQT
jgi:hypothetical protein